LTRRVTELLPVWALALSILAWAFPAPFVGMKPAIVWLLALVMLGMGLGLRATDFRRTLSRPRDLALGAFLQFLVMPLAAWAVSRAFGLDSVLLAGMVLVGASPGGTASNVITFLARGDVALSVSLTTLSTLLAPLATPLLTWAYAGQAVEVPVLRMFVSVLAIVVLPVALGVWLHARLGRRLRPVGHFFPLISVAAIALIIAIIVALNRERLASVGPLLLLAVALHNGAGLAAGYLGARILGRDRRTARTLAIEVGMQNSGLAVALALQHFPALAALPGALFSVWHNLSGALLAAIWARRSDPCHPR